MPASQAFAAVAIAGLAAGLTVGAVIPPFRLARLIVCLAGATVCAMAAVYLVTL